MADFAFDPNRGAKDGYPPGFDEHSTRALRRAGYVGGGRKALIRHPADFDTLHRQGHLEKHPEHPEFYGKEIEGPKGQTHFEVQLTPVAHALMNHMHG